MFDGLFCDQLLLLVPLHTAHYAEPNESNNRLLRDVVLLDFLTDVGNDL